MVMGLLLCLRRQRHRRQNKGASVWPYTMKDPSSSNAMEHMTSVDSPSHLFDHRKSLGYGSSKGKMRMSYFSASTPVDHAPTPYSGILSTTSTLTVQDGSNVPIEHRKISKRKAEMRRGKDVVATTGLSPLDTIRPSTADHMAAGTREIRVREDDPEHPLGSASYGSDSEPEARASMVRIESPAPAYESIE
ncbi:hypothetical protein H0H87_002144 [Tephrocybe sp. NHM501043]|nr:hypothetical protein H0H87_002144 [Tephrocybe sp. NHM501043]